MSEMQELRMRAKEAGINTFGKSKSDILAMLEPRKAGRRSWRPANLLDIEGKDSNFRYRMCRSDDANLSRKLQEGWEFVNATTDPEARVIGAGTVNDGRSVDTTQRQRELVAMRLPEELARERDEHYAEEVQRRKRDLKRKAQSEMGADAKGRSAPVTGKIIIE
jgi:hypothetical protein